MTSTSTFNSERGSDGAPVENSGGNLANDAVRADVVATLARLDVNRLAERIIAVAGSIASEHRRSEAFQRLIKSAWQLAIAAPAGQSATGHLTACSSEDPQEQVQIVSSEVTQREIRIILRRSIEIFIKEIEPNLHRLRMSDPAKPSGGAKGMIASLVQSVFRQIRREGGDADRYAVAVKLATAVLGYGISLLKQPGIGNSERRALLLCALQEAPTDDGPPPMLRDQVTDTVDALGIADLVGDVAGMAVDVGKLIAGGGSAQDVITDIVNVALDIVVMALKGTLAVVADILGVIAIGLSFGIGALIHQLSDNYQKTLNVAKCVTEWGNAYKNHGYKYSDDKSSLVPLPAVIVGVDLESGTIKFGSQYIYTVDQSCWNNNGCNMPFPGAGHQGHDKRLSVREALKCPATDRLPRVDLPIVLPGTHVVTMNWRMTNAPGACTSGDPSFAIPGEISNNTGLWWVAFNCTGTEYGIVEWPPSGWTAKDEHTSVDVMMNASGSTIVLPELYDESTQTDARSWISYTITSTGGTQTIVLGNYPASTYTLKDLSSSTNPTKWVIDMRQVDRAKAGEQNIKLSSASSQHGIMIGPKVGRVNLQDTGTTGRRSLWVIQVADFDPIPYDNPNAASITFNSSTKVLTIGPVSVEIPQWGSSDICVFGVKGEILWIEPATAKLTLLAIDEDKFKKASQSSWTLDAFLAKLSSSTFNAEYVYRYASQFPCNASGRVILYNMRAKSSIYFDNVYNSTRWGAPLGNSGDMWYFLVYVDYYNTQFSFTKVRTRRANTSDSHDINLPLASLGAGTSPRELRGCTHGSTFLLAQHFSIDGSGDLYFIYEHEPTHGECRIREIQLPASLYHGIEVNRVLPSYLKTALSSACSQGPWLVPYTALINQSATSSMLWVRTPDWAILDALPPPPPPSSGGDGELESMECDTSPHRSSAVLGLYDEAQKRTVIVSNLLGSMSSLQYLGADATGAAAFLFDKDAGKLYRQALLSPEEAARLRRELLRTESAHTIAPPVTPVAPDLSIQSAAAIGGGITATTQEGLVFELSEPERPVLVAVTGAWVKARGEAICRELAELCERYAHGEVVTLQEAHQPARATGFYHVGTGIVFSGMDDDHAPFEGAELSYLGYDSATEQGVLFDARSRRIRKVGSKGSPGSAKSSLLPGVYAEAFRQGRALLVRSDSAADAEIHPVVVDGVDTLVMSGGPGADTYLIDDEAWRAFEQIIIDNRDVGRVLDRIVLPSRTRRLFVDLRGEDLVFTEEGTKKRLILRKAGDPTEAGDRYQHADVLIGAWNTLSVARLVATLRDVRAAHGPEAVLCVGVA